jgi:hypothetical protein
MDDDQNKNQLAQLCRVLSIFLDGSRLGKEFLLQIAETSRAHSAD